LAAEEEPVQPSQAEAANEATPLIQSKSAKFLQVIDDQQIHTESFKKQVNPFLKIPFNLVRLG
jgi:hypothetical protein